MKKSIVKYFVSVVVLSVASVLLFSCATENSNQVENEVSTTVWTEVPLLEAGSVGTSSGLIELKPRETIEQADYIFSGTIVDIKEYKVSYLDKDTGRVKISLYHTVMEVKVDKEYKGTNPAEGDTIKIYYAFTLSITRDASVLIRDETSYLFITNLFDEEYFKESEKEPSSADLKPEEYADAYIGEAIYSIVPIVDSTAFMRTDFFDNMPDVLAKSIDAKCDLVPEGFLERKVSAALKMEDFEPALAEIIKNPSLIPER